MGFFSRCLTAIISFLFSVPAFIGTLPGFTAADIGYETACGNPLKGFVPFSEKADSSDGAVRYSMEFFYIPLSELIRDDGTYRIREGLEPHLEKAASRSHQSIFRVYLDYPASEMKDGAVPKYIWDMGVKKIPYTEFGGGISPDYTDDRLIDELVRFIKALAKEYDGDRRIAYITAGLLGHWGEWHCFACPEAMASYEQQEKIANAFTESFTKTKILMRYPGTPGTGNGKTGFHDDSFTYETLGDKSSSWFFMNRLKKAKQTKNWQTQPIGGEFRPEGQSDFLDGKASEEYQNFDECVKKTHCSWLMMNGAFSAGLTSEQAKRAEEASASLGYDLTVKKAAVRRIFGKSTVTVAVKNVGNAPLYTDAEIIIKCGETEIKANGKPLSELIPGCTFLYKASFSPTDGNSISVKISSPGTLTPIRFSNTGCGSDGILTLGKIG